MTFNRCLELGTMKASLKPCQPDWFAGGQSMCPELSQSVFSKTKIGLPASSPQDGIPPERFESTLPASPEGNIPMRSGV